MRSAKPVSYTHLDVYKRQSINRMYSVTRNRETIYAEYIFGNPPDFADVPEYYSRYNTFHICLLYTSRCV